MITWITEQVAIGDADDSRGITQEKFEAALNVAVDLDICDKVDPEVRNFNVRRHKAGLLDGAGNHPFMLVAAVLMLEGLVSQQKRVLVHCQAGQSRSVMVVSAWMAFKGLTTLDDALAKNLAIRKVDMYRDSMYALAVSALDLLKKLHQQTNTQKG